MATTATPRWDISVGIDWAHIKHDYCVEHGQLVGTFDNTPEAIDEFVMMLTRTYPGKQLGIILEQSHGSLIYALQKYSFVTLIPINPSQLASFRKCMQPSGKSDDRSDAWLLMELLIKHGDRLRVWTSDSQEFRQLQLLVEHRREFVNARTRLVLQLKDALKKYFPLILQLSEKVECPLILALLQKWPTLEKLQRQKPEYLRQFFRQRHCRNEASIQERLDLIAAAKPLTNDPALVGPLSLQVQLIVQQLHQLHQAVEQYDEEIQKTAATNQDVALFQDVRGVGPQLAPRLAVAFGSDRSRYTRAQDVQDMAGISPVTKKSGKKLLVHRRYAASKFLRQTFHELALQMVRYSDWSKAYYELQKARGKGRHTALRALAYKWIRILYAMWKNNTPYSEERYIQQLVQKNNAELLKYLPKTIGTT